MLHNIAEIVEAEYDAAMNRFYAYIQWRKTAPVNASIGTSNHLWAARRNALAILGEHPELDPHEVWTSERNKTLVRVRGLEA